MAITFHADLLGANLEDFDSHFRVPLNFIGGFMRRQPGVPPLIWSDIRTEEFIEDPYNVVFPDTTISRARYTDYEKAKIKLATELQKSKAAAQSATGLFGFVQVVISVRGPRITYEATLLAAVRNEKVVVEDNAKVYFLLYVARYRDRRLKLLLDEADEKKTPYANLIRNWIEPRWGSALRLLPIEGAPWSDTNESVALTEREIEIAKLLAQGMDDDQIAHQLVIAKGTVINHRKSIARKWDTTSHLVLMQEFARQKGYLEDRSK